MKRFYLQTVRVTFAAILLSFPLAFVLPVEISFENAVLENIQVIVLIATTILNLLLCGKGMVEQLDDHRAQPLHGLGRLLLPHDEEER